MGCLGVILTLAVALPAMAVNPVLGLLVLGGGLWGAWRLEQKAQEEAQKAQEEAQRAREEARKAREEKRKRKLTDRFGPDVAQRILSKEFWQGATHEMIAESLGAPLEIDEKVLKSKTKHVYKYNELGKGRYALRVMFEDGICVGWEDKRGW